MNQLCLDSEHVHVGFGGGGSMLMFPDFSSAPPPFFGLDAEDGSSEGSGSTLPLTSLESSLLAYDPRGPWDESSDSANSPKLRPERAKSSEQFPSPTMPFTGVTDQPLNHFVSIAFSPHQLSHLPQSPTPIEALHLTPASLYPYSVMPGHAGQHAQREPDHARKYVRKLLVTKPRTLSQSKKIVRTLLQQSKTLSPASLRLGEGSDPQDSSGLVKRRFCHVCRSAKEVSKVVVCSSGKQSHVFCSSCVRRRLGLEFDALLQLPDWICPKCNDQCPCSKCRKK